MMDVSDELSGAIRHLAVLAALAATDTEIALQETAVTVGVPRPQIGWWGLV